MVNRIFRPKFTIEILLLLLLITWLRSEPLSTGEIETAVTTWIRLVTPNPKPEAVIELMEPYLDQGDTLAYIAHIKGGGFCLCGTDNMVMPVYLYISDSEYNPEVYELDYFLNEIVERTKYMRACSQDSPNVMNHYAIVLEKREELWEDLLASRVPRRLLERSATTEEPDSMRLKLTTCWGQHSVFNDSCPPQPVFDPSPKEECPAGCVAIALAQIMNYWKWPPRGVGSGSVDYDFSFTNDSASWPLSYDPSIPWGWKNSIRWHSPNLYLYNYWDSAKLEIVLEDSTICCDTCDACREAIEQAYNLLTPITMTSSANFRSTTYRWDLLRDQDSLYTTSAESSAIATLCHHAGVAAEMNYGTDGSGTSDDDARDALVNHFRYHSDATTSPVILPYEIQMQRPLYFSGQKTEGGGHAWVIYGYDLRTEPDILYLMNFGWSCGSDGWYTRDTIDYCDDQGAIGTIAPRRGSRFVVDEDIYGTDNNGSPIHPYWGIESIIEDSDDILAGTTLIFKTSKTFSFSSRSAVIDFPVFLKGRNVLIKHE
ncbi:C10 family peptidase [bacterium]|nr:C10 family peptidase [bacterium]